MRKAESENQAIPKRKSLLHKHKVYLWEPNIDELADRAHGMPHYETCADRHGDESFGTMERSSFSRSHLDLISEEERWDLMYALPMKEGFNLIHYESKPNIGPLAQVVPSLNTKSKQIPKVSLVPGSNKNRPKNRASDHDILANKMTSFSSFKKKHSNQIARNKLSNYINTKVGQFVLLDFIHIRTK